MKDVIVAYLSVITGILKNYPNESGSWKEVANRVGQYLATLDESRELIKLSFDHLPYNLKPCFLYLGMFPEDFKIPVWRLLRLWVAEGFVDGSDEDDISLEKKAEKYLEYLISRHLVIVEKRKVNGNIKTCSLHDALRDFCRKGGMTQQLFDIEGKGSHSSNSATKVRRIVSKFKECDNDKKKIRTLLDFTTEDPITEEAAKTSKILKSFKLLRILDVRSIKFKGFPTELYYLVILKYIAVSTDWGALPEKFSKLKNLQTIIIDTSSFEFKILANIWELERLRHIHIKASTCLPEVQQDTKVKPNLQTLSTISPESCTEQVFKKTPKLKKLGIRGQLANYMEQIFNNISELKALENLKLENTNANAKLHDLPDDKKFPSLITRLTLFNTHLEWKHMSTLGKLKQLEVLKLKKHAFVGETWETEDGGFISLKVLHIAETDLVNWKAKAENFEKLTFLIFRDCKELKSIPKELADIKSLRRIELQHWTLSALRCAKEIKEKTKNSEFKLDNFPQEA